MYGWMKTLVQLSALLVAVDCGRMRTSFEVGHRHPAENLVEHAEEKGRGSPDYSLSFSRTYNYQVITMVAVKDVIASGGGAYAAIVAGGPGQTYVTLTYTVLRHADFHYEVKVYGKPPAFHKIP
ncbi:probable salivary secreted peptide isoform X2 [Copidosoma floridanum]|uniref:probable salivary secreted peptide isoform X2 n=1 Tax=Copidosoma floridanum TaxID=29053 RepID=UPI0006C9D9D4|nr:probable salivary secreted peptide isoform X2 [Copidosoma floridanum]